MSINEPEFPSAILGADDIALRDWLAINATEDQIARFRGSYRNPSGGFQMLHKHTIEQARYRYADAMLAARQSPSAQADGAPNIEESHV